MILKNKIAILALGHGLNDLIAGYFIGSYAANNTDLLQVGIAISVYNILAFGGQYPVAILMEKINNTKNILVFSYLLNVAAIATFLLLPVLAIVFAGIASAIYHVTGGSHCAENNKAVNIGLFAAPGVAGLIAGGLLAWKNYNIIPFLLPIATAFLFILSRIKFTSYVSEKTRPGNEQQTHFIDRHDLIMILLLMIISLRSVIWNVFQLIYENNYQWLIAITIAAVVGKIAGGWVADRIGWRVYALSSAILATPLLTFFKKEMILFCLGIGLLQSGIPATTSLLIHSLKGKTSRGVALSFGVAIVLGSAVSIFPTQELNKQMPYILLASIILLIMYGRWDKRIAGNPF